MPICIYCNREKPASEFSEEHVIPRKIGGVFSPINPFVIRNVCNRCNNLAGLFIDSEFIKSYFTQNNRAHFDLKYVDITSNPILPLTYMGICEELIYEDNICEIWLGPTGDSIFHFHLPYPDEPNMSSIIGPNPVLEMRDSDYDKGFAFIFAVPTNPVWHPTVFYSFVNNFPGSIYYLGNGPTPRGGAFTDIPDSLDSLHHKLRETVNNGMHVRLVIGAHYGDRFLAKLGLGFGSLFLNDLFVSSSDAQLLRNFMWERDATRRANIPIMGMSFLNNQQSDIMNFLKWNGGHFIYFAFDGRATRLFLSFYENQNAGVLVSNNPNHWPNELTRREFIFIITPSLKRIVGPLTLMEYVVHKQNLHINQDLKSLEDDMNRFGSLPLKHTGKSLIIAKLKKWLHLILKVFGIKYQ